MTTLTEFNTSNNSEPFWAQPDFKSEDEMEHALASSANGDIFTRALAMVLNAPSDAFGGAHRHCLVMEALRQAKRLHHAHKMHLRQSEANDG